MQTLNQSGSSAARQAVAVQKWWALYDQSMHALIKTETYVQNITNRVHQCNSFWIENWSPSLLAKIAVGCSGRGANSYTRVVRTVECRGISTDECVIPLLYSLDLTRVEFKFWIWR